jgi:predicted GIY-YIG superfamily endonuclease
MQYYVGESDNVSKRFKSHQSTLQRKYAVKIIAAALIALPHSEKSTAKLIERDLQQRMFSKVCIQLLSHGCCVASWCHDTCICYRDGSLASSNNTTSLLRFTVWHEPCNATRIVHVQGFPMLSMSDSRNRSFGSAGKQHVLFKQVT